ncbi:MAG TPA: carboxypeptidase-like regulatory domain-containing protein [Pyrinomonadaceae bacterium]|nr:carboxypeptidase-like regulatory domain-containing protein [Pyrinomonadaceae bacterium]
MRKLILAVAVCLSFVAVPATAQNNSEIPNRGVAPKTDGGLGRLDLRVFDSEGRPVRGAQAKLTSQRGGGFLCETWNTTDARGVAVLPPLKVGSLKLSIKAPGFRAQTLTLSPSDLGRPVQVTLARS